MEDARRLGETAADFPCLFFGLKLWLLEAQLFSRVLALNSTPTQNYTSMDLHSEQPHKPGGVEPCLLGL
jgi:hypothetical protein